MKLIILFALVAVSRASSLGLKLAVPVAEPITPYAFGYTADAIDGSSSRQESADASGVVRGSYSVISADGIKRVVNYIADENGFRAQVQTNEPGTESKNSADVLMLSSQPPAEEIALKYGSKPQLTQLPQLSLLGVKGQHFPVKKTFFKTLETPLLPETKFVPSIETPIRLLSRMPKTPIVLQKSEEIFGQNYESF